MRLSNGQTSENLSLLLTLQHLVFYIYNNFASTTVPLKFQIKKFILVFELGEI
jgi:hypothetical protein